MTNPSKATLATRAFRKVQTCKEAIQKHDAACKRANVRAIQRAEKLSEALKTAEAELEKLSL